jgi:hypothetical protein
LVWEECDCGSGKEYGREKGYIDVPAAVARIPVPVMVEYGWLPSSVFKGRVDGVVALDPNAEVASAAPEGSGVRCVRSETVVDCWSKCCFCTSPMTKDVAGEVSLVQSDRSESPRA